MPAKYSDSDIARLLAERKPLPPDYRTSIQLRDKRGHKERELDVIGANGSRFRLILRQSDHNPLDFSIILGICPTETGQLFRLKRYNGRSHEHTNLIEGDRFYDFHIHMATERYQDLGVREDSYAEATQEYADLHGALSSMLKDCAFDVPKGPQQALFEEI